MGRGALPTYSGLKMSLYQKIIQNYIQIHMSKKVNPHQRRVFEQDQYNDEHAHEEDSFSEDESIEEDLPQHQPRSEHISQEEEQPNGDEAEPRYDTLNELIADLNDKDHSEDEGIEDYKIGGYHPCHVGEVLVNRYVLIQKLGWGHFSTVWLAKDFKYGNYAAVKIMKSSPHYLEASYDEVQILQKVASNAYHPEWIQSLRHYQPNKTKYDRDDCHVLNLLNSFLYKGPYGNHFCMVFEILGVNLLEVLKRYDYKGLPLDLVKEISRQVLMGLDFLNRICRVIHTDLKPENVLLCLTEQEIKQIVEKGQLSSKELYRDRLRLYRQKYHLGPEEDSQSEEEEVLVQEIKKEPILPKEVNSEEEDDQDPFGGELSGLTTRISEIKERLEGKDLNKNQRKNLRRKLKRFEEKASELQHQEKPKEDSKIEKNIDGVAARPKVRVPREKKSIGQLFSAFRTKLILDKGPKLEKGFKVKIADLGNACWEHHHFATEIQTRQYRGPEVLTGSKYNLSADMWSLACMTFEMLTGELLFNPRKDQNDNFGKNDDHLAQMMELLGRFPKKFSLRGAKARKYFSKEGNLVRIPKLQNWSLKDVMIAKYRFTEKQAEFFESFMLPMLNCYPEKRILSDRMLSHPWLYTPSPPEYFMSSEEHEKIKAERYDLQVQKDELYQYESEQEDAETEDNGNETESDDEFFGYEKVGDIRYIDRSFMDLGYIGYGDGIFLEKLDFGPNWQFDA